MAKSVVAVPNASVVVPPLPGWSRLARDASVEEAAFAAGAALAHLQRVGDVSGLPLALWRDRLALMAAEVCVGLAGRREGQAALRDAVHLTRPGDDPGPAGAVLAQWSRAVARPLSVAHLCQAITGVTAEQVALSLDVAGGHPVDRAARVIEAVLTDAPRAESAALILADAVLARGTGQKHVLPLVSLTITARDLRLRGDDLRMACHRAVVSGTEKALPVAADLAQRAARLQAVIPKLRAKQAGLAISLFLSHDAVAPGELSFMSDRAARRLCDRLVGLGAVRELTGRDSFRLYGV